MILRGLPGDTAAARAVSACWIGYVSHSCNDDVLDEEALRGLFIKGKLNSLNEKVPLNLNLFYPMLLKQS